LPFEFTRPWGLALGALLAPLVLLYLLRVRRRRVVVPATLLWRSAQRDLMATSPFRRLVAEPSLLLQGLALILLALALGGPVARGRATVTEHVGVVIDLSASMRAIEPESGKSRMELALAVADDVLTGLGPGSDAFILAASRSPRWLTPLISDRRPLRRALQQLQAEDVPADLEAALAAAVDRLSRLGGSKRLVLITDGAAVAPSLLAHVALPVELRRLGSNLDNSAIVALDVQRQREPLTRKETVAAFALVQHVGSQPKELFVSLLQAGVAAPLASRKLRLVPGERQPVLLEFEPAEADTGMGLELRLEPADALGTDDHAYSRVPERAALPVWLAGAAADSWFARALTADRDVHLQQVDSASVSASAGGGCRQLP
jgi:hypothetical protein